MDADLLMRQSLSTALDWSDRALGEMGVKACDLSDELKVSLIRTQLVVAAVDQLSMIALHGIETLSQRLSELRESREMGDWLP